MPISPTSPARHVLVRAERTALAELMLQRGPEAATLCAGWNVLDLAAHIVVRESRPDAAAGVVVKPLRAHTERVMADVAAAGLEVLAERIRTGPPRWWPTRLAAVGGRVDLAEFLVHHEDVRRADGTGPRTAVPALQQAAWQELRTSGRVALARSGVGVVVVRPDGVRRVVRPGAYPVVLTGEPIELLLFAYGREEQADVQISGPALSQRRFTERARSV